MKNRVNLRITFSTVLVIFLTIAPLIGGFLPLINFNSEDNNENISVFLGEYFPFIHLTIAQLGGLPFAELFGGLFALFIFIFGLVGFLIYFVSGFKKTGGIKLFLFITIIYCLLRGTAGLILNIIVLISGNTFSHEMLVGITGSLSDFLWAFLCWRAAKVFSSNGINTRRDAAKLQ